MTDAVPPRVSVIVPVYNTGAYIEPLLESLAGQSLPAAEFEILLVDDGSTDDTSARLDAFAAEHDNVRVFHEPNSGWPGRPRNVGIDAARGRYVFFVDHDDWLGREALERLTGFGDTYGSDIVVGKQAGHHRAVPHALFRRTMPAATIETAPLMSGLTPHMMFRRAFLDAHGLRFPEGRRRLEDHVFVTAAYFLAERISIYADYCCYFHIGRDDVGNAGFRRIDPDGYFGNVREVVDVVRAHTAPGRRRDDVLRRSLRGEVLGRVSGRGFLDADPEYQQAVFRAARATAVATMPLSVDAGLDPVPRVRAALLRADRLDDVMALAGYERGIGVRAHLDRLGWDADGGLVLDVEASLADVETGTPWTYRRTVEGRLRLGLPARFVAGLPEETIEATADVDAAGVEVVARRRADSEEWALPGEVSISAVGEQDVSLVHRAQVRLDPLVLAGGEPVRSGIWDLYVRLTQAGWVKERRLGSDRAPGATGGVGTALLGDRLVAAYWTASFDNLSLDVGATPNRLLAKLRAAGPSVAVEGGHRLRLTLPLTVPREVQVRGTVRLSRGSDRVDLDAAGTASGSELDLAAELPRLGAGTWTVAVGVAARGWDEPRDTGATLTVSRLLRRVSV
ncbi:MAG TPA: glycosyltransferase family 2 protein [Jatrophihabitans sp.]|nr:glycosyltransferase family 2 protein [Jatrophihabitans sp.]